MDAAEWVRDTVLAESCPEERDMGVVDIAVELSDTEVDVELLVKLLNDLDALDALDVLEVLLTESVAVADVNTLLL